jgi:glycosyltransferase involved in cell wall biosynthesis
MTNIKVIIPAYNEEKSISQVIQDIPDHVSEVIVVNNNSSDSTEEKARDAGATVLIEKRMGYGYACLKGINYISGQRSKPQIVVFLDGDYSDYPEELDKIVAPIIDENFDFVVGARRKELREKGSMTYPQIFGNWLSTTLMNIIYGSDFTDLGPFRAIKYDVLNELKMEDTTYGWTVEMQLKVLKKKFTYTEIPVRYRNRIGTSKVSGTLKGVIFAGIKILGWIFKYSFKK